MPQRRETRRGPRRRSKEWKPPNPFLLLDVHDPAERREALRLEPDATDAELEARYRELYMGDEAS